MAHKTTDDKDLEDLINIDGPETRNVIPMELGVGFGNGAAPNSPFASLIAVTAPIKESYRRSTVGGTLPSDMSRPRLCVLCTAICSIVAFIAIACFGGREEKLSDFTTVNSIYDLKLSFIHHWCLDGTDDCPCEDPLSAVPSNMNAKSWENTHIMNMKLIEDYVARVPSQDIVFLGDSITEFWNGSNRANPMPAYNKVPAIFKSLFDRSSGAPIDGLALGISADTGPNLLYRIQNGEMPNDLNPKIWMVLIGINDMKGKNCSEEAVIMSIARIVQEIRFRKPDATVLINAILPSGQGRSMKLGGLWHAIKRVNKELLKFSAKHDKVRFVDMGKIFIDSDSNGSMLSSELMPDALHPNALGYQMLGESIQKEALSILRDLEPN